MTVAVLIVTTVSLIVILWGAHVARNWTNGTIDVLNRTRQELRPALVKVQTDAERSAALRASLMADPHDRSR